MSLENRALAQATTPVSPLPGDEPSTALRTLGTRLTAWFGLDYSLDFSRTPPVMTLVGHLDQGKRTLRLTAEHRPDDGGRVWIFYLDPADDFQPIAEATSPDLFALLMRARRTRM